MINLRPFTFVAQYQIMSYNGESAAEARDREEREREAEAYLRSISPGLVGSSASRQVLAGRAGGGVQQRSAPVGSIKTKTVVTQSGKPNSSGGGSTMQSIVVGQHQADALSSLTSNIQRMQAEEMRQNALKRIKATHRSVNEDQVITASSSPASYTTPKYGGPVGNASQGGGSWRQKEQTDGPQQQTATIPVNAATNRSPSPVNRSPSPSQAVKKSTVVAGIQRPAPPATVGNSAATTKAKTAGTASSVPPLPSVTFDGKKMQTSTTVATSGVQNSSVNKPSAPVVNKSPSAAQSTAAAPPLPSMSFGVPKKSPSPSPSPGSSAVQKPAMPNQQAAAPSVSKPSATVAAPPLPSMSFGTPKATPSSTTAPPPANAASSSVSKPAPPKVTSSLSNQKPVGGVEQPSKAVSTPPLPSMTFGASKKTPSPIPDEKPAAASSSAPSQPAAASHVKGSEYTTSQPTC